MLQRSLEINIVETMKRVNYIKSCIVLVFLFSVLLKGSRHPLICNLVCCSSFTLLRNVSNIRPSQRLDDTLRYYVLSFILCRFVYNLEKGKIIVAFTSPNTKNANRRIVTVFQAIARKIFD